MFQGSDAWVEVRSVTAGGPGLVAGGGGSSGDDGDAAVWVSADGYTWTRVPDDGTVLGGPGDQWIWSVTAGGPGLVAVGASGPEGNPTVWVSADGYAWTRVPDDEAVFGGERSPALLSVVAGGPGVVAVGDYHPDYSDEDAGVWVSSDGWVWTRAASEALGGPGDQFIRSVTAGGPGLVAVGGVSGDDPEIPDGAVWVSVDGYTWTRVPDDQGVFRGAWIYSVAAGGTGVVAVGADGFGTAAVWVSEDGYAWTRADVGQGGILSVAAGGPGLVAVGSSGWDAAVWVSEDGYAWTRVPDDEEAFSEGTIDLVTAGGPGLVAVCGMACLDIAVWVSPPPG